MSTVGFASIQNDDLVLVCGEDLNSKVYAPNPDFREFGIEKDAQEVFFSDLTQSTRNYPCTPMIQFVLLAKYVSEYLRGATSLRWIKDNKLDDVFLKSSFINSIQKFVDSYIEWLEGMSDNDRVPRPFKPSVKSSDLYSTVDGVKPGSIEALWVFNKPGYNLFDAALNEEHSLLSRNFMLPHKFTESFYNITKLLVDKKHKF